MKPIYVVYNARSGSAKTTADLRRACDDAGIEQKRLIPIDGQLAKRLAKPIAHGSTIAVVGGDGTMNTLANLLVGTKAVMAPLPGGTFNHFTRDLGVPQDIASAIARLPGLKPRKIDTVRVNDTYFVNNSLLGLYPYSLQIRSTLQDRYGKWPAALIAVVRALMQFHAYRITIGKTTYQTPFVFIGNNNFGLERMGLPGRKRFDGGIISVYIARARTRRDVIKLSWLALLGRLKDADEFEILKIERTFTVGTRRPSMRVSHDGELSRMATPLVYTMHPKSLRVLY